MEEMVDLELGKVKYKLYLEYFVGQENKEARQQKQEELQSCSLWNENHIHRKTDKMKRQGFHGGAVVENLPANAGDTGSRPGLGRSHMPRSN